MALRRFEVAFQWGPKSEAKDFFAPEGSGESQEECAQRWSRQKGVHAKLREGPSLKFHGTMRGLAPHLPPKSFGGTRFFMVKTALVSRGLT